MENNPPIYPDYNSTSIQPLSGFGLPTAATTLPTVVVVQPQPTPEVKQSPREWSTDLFGCFSDVGSCFFGLFCPWCMACTIAGKMGEHCCTSLIHGGALALRTKIRMQYGIQGDICSDFCTLWWCGSCALCQMARELKHMGL